MRLAALGLLLAALPAARAADLVIVDDGRPKAAIFVPARVWDDPRANPEPAPVDLGTDSPSGNACGVRTGRPAAPPGSAPRRAASTIGRARRRTGSGRAWSVRRFVGAVVPLLQERGLFRAGYHGAALCDRRGIDAASRLPCVKVFGADSGVFGG